MLSTLFLYFLVAVIATFFFYLLGGVVIYFLKISVETSFLKVFTFILCGIIVTVFFYSIVVAHFKTVNLGLTIPFVFLLSFLFKDSKLRKTFANTLHLNYNIISLTATVLFLICGYSFYFIYDFHHHILIAPERDKVFYARVADYLNNKGIESNYLNYFEANQPTPFHYFEIWITSFIQLLSVLNTLMIQQLVVNSILSLTLFFGVVSFVNCIKRVTIFDIIICLFIPFFIGIKFSFFPHQLFHHIDGFFFLNPMIRQKYFIIDILFIAVSILFFRKKNDYALMILLMGCVANFSLIASIPITVILLCFVIKIENKLQIIVASILTLIFISFFYYFNKNSSTMFNNPSLWFLINDTFSSIINMKIALNNIAKSVTETFFIYLPFLIIIVFYIHYNKIIDEAIKHVTITVLILFFVSVFEWSVMNKKLDSIQIFDNISVPITGIFFFMIALLFISKASGYRLCAAYFFISIWGMICFINTTIKLNNTKKYELSGYSPEYLREVNGTLNLLNSNGGALTKIDGQYTFVSSLFMAYSYKNYLATMKNKINITLLENTMDIRLPDDSIYREQIMERQKMELFNVFIHRKKKNAKFVSEGQCRVDFIKENNLEFIIAERDAEVDSSIQLLTEKTIIDKVSGERFMILKK